MTRGQIWDELKRHDWFYEYSDDHRVYQRGHNHARTIQRELKRHDCPFEWWQIHDAVFKENSDSNIVAWFEDDDEMCSWCGERPGVSMQRPTPGSFDAVLLCEECLKGK